MADVKVTVSRRGPLLVQGAGSIELVDARGNSFPVEKDSIALCRCGASENKPFCDGTHRDCGFEGASEAR